jgi:hypothetical protein
MHELYYKIWDNDFYSSYDYRKDGVTSQQQQQQQVAESSIAVSKRSLSDLPVS